jgi:hypothetical protein
MMPELKNDIRLYDSIYKLPYSIFKEILVEGDPELLIINGNPDKSILLSTWESLIEMYSELLRKDSLEDIQYWQVYRSYMHYSQKQKRERLIINTLSICYNEAWCKSLYGSLLIANQWQRLNPNDMEAYHKELDILFARTKNVYVNIYKVELEELQNRRKGQIESEDLKPTYETFLTIENNLDLMFKQQFDYDKMSTAKFVDLVKRYHRSVDQINRQNKK